MWKETILLDEPRNPKGSSVSVTGREGVAAERWVPSVPGSEAVGWTAPGGSASRPCSVALTPPQSRVRRAVAWGQTDYHDLSRMDVFMSLTTLYRWLLKGLLRLGVWSHCGLEHFSARILQSVSGL